MTDEHGNATEHMSENITITIGVIGDRELTFETSDIESYLPQPEDFPDEETRAIEWTLSVEVGDVSWPYADHERGTELEVVFVGDELLVTRGKIVDSDAQEGTIEISAPIPRDWRDELYA